MNHAEFKVWHGRTRRYKKAGAHASIAKFCGHRETDDTGLEFPGNFGKFSANNILTWKPADPLVQVAEYRKTALNLAVFTKDKNRARKFNGGIIPRNTPYDGEYRMRLSRAMKREVGFSQLVMIERAIQCDVMMKDILRLMRGEAA